MYKCETHGCDKQQVVHAGGKTTYECQECDRERVRAFTRGFDKPVATGSGEPTVETRFRNVLVAIRDYSATLEVARDRANGILEMFPPTPPAIQSAGAREYEYPPEVKIILARCEANVISFSNDDVSTLLVEIDRLAQQTAATAAALKAAERERDSLREQCDAIADDYQDLGKELAKLSAENAALKAGKDGRNV